MNDIVCPECHGKDAVLDFAAGDVVCAECGLVIDSHYIDDKPEWRTFSGETETTDRSRVGECYNSLLPDGGISTTISPRGGAQEGSVSSLVRAENRLSTASGNRSKILAALRRSATIAGRLGLVFTIQCRANEIFQKIHALSFTKGRNQDAILASCVYVACRQEDKPRTMKEICSVTEGVTKKELGRAILTLVKHLEQEAGGGGQAQDFIRGFCGQLGVHRNATRAAIEVAKSAERDLDIRKNPTSIATAAVFMILQLVHGPENVNQCLDDISRVCGVSSATIWSTYTLLHSHSSKLIPPWFAHEERLRDLPSPKPKVEKSSKRKCNSDPTPPT